MVKRSTRFRGKGLPASAKSKVSKELKLGIPCCASCAGGGHCGA